MKRFGLIIVLTLLILGIAAYRMAQAPEVPGRSVHVEIAQGADVNGVSRQLRNAGLIRSSFAFETYLWFTKSESRIKAGSYQISTDTGLLQLVNMLIQGPATGDSSVTLIEGWTLREYRSYLEKRNFDVDEFDRLTAKASDRVSEYDFLTGVPAKATLEGYLFPDTYAVGPDMNIGSLVAKMLDNFDRKVGAEERKRISAQELSVHEAVTLASIVEKEVATTADRRKVADIFLRRLKAGIGLQSDATINYITRSGRARSTASDLAIDSPYNTYKYRGLPPGPIGNPGLDSISAVLNPEPNTNLYFLTDSEGTVYYARTYEEHLENKWRHL